MALLVRVWGGSTRADTVPPLARPSTPAHRTRAPPTPTLAAEPAASAQSGTPAPLQTSAGSMAAAAATRLRVYVGPWQCYMGSAAGAST